MAVDFSLDGSQQAVHDVFTAFLADRCGVDVVRAAEPLGWSAEVWDALRTMEAPGMAAPIDVGGGGATVGQLVIAAEALGAALAPVPLIEHWVASTVWPEPDVIAGSAVATIAHAPAVDGPAGRSWRLVPGGAVADVVVGVDGDHLVVVRSDPPMAAPPNHGAAPIADRLVGGDLGEHAPVDLGPAASIEAARDLWRVLTAAALVGLADRALALGVGYVTERQQFGRPIGSFQAVQHGLADLPGLIDGARFLVHKAAWASDTGRVDGAGDVDLDEGVITEFAPLAAMAFLQAADAAAAATDRAMQYHGGYGFSLEYDIQLWFRRARAWPALLGDREAERLRLADLLLGPVGVR